MQKILIVEDDEKLRDELEIFLENNGYQAEALKTDPQFNSTESVCMSLGWLKKEGYTENKQNYKGSVLVTYASGQYSYKYWIANGTYAFLGADANTGYNDTTKVVDYVSTTHDDTLNNCGKTASDNWTVLS